MFRLVSSSAFIKWLTNFWSSDNFSCSEFIRFFARSKRDWLNACFIRQVLLSEVSPRIVEFFRPKTVSSWSFSFTDLPKMEELTLVWFLVWFLVQMFENCKLLHQFLDMDKGCLRGFQFYFARGFRQNWLCQ